MDDLLNGVEITDERRRLVDKSGNDPCFITNLEVAEYCRKMNYKLLMIGRISFAYECTDGFQRYSMVQACRVHQEGEPNESA